MYLLFSLVSSLPNCLYVSRFLGSDQLSRKQTVYTFAGQSREVSFFLLGPTLSLRTCTSAASTRGTTSPFSGDLFVSHWLLWKFARKLQDYFLCSQMPCQTITKKRFPSMPCGSQLPLWCATCWPAVFLEAVKICCVRVRSPAADARERVCLSFGEHVRSSAQTLVNGCAYDSARAQCYAERVCISCGSRVCGAAYNFDRLRRWACLPLQEPKQMLCCSPAERNHFAPNPPPRPE